MGIASDLFNETPQQGAVNAPVLETPKFDTVQSLYGTPDAQKEDSLQFVMDETIDEKPERTARALELQKRTGIPKKFIDENFDELDKAAKQEEFNSREYLKTSPKVSDWLLRNPDYAPLLREDIDTMGSLEQTISKASDYVRAIGQGIVGQGAGTTLSGAGELYGVATRAVDRGLSAVLPDNVMEALRAPTPWWLDPEQILKRPGEELKEFGEQIGVPVERQGIDTDIASGIGQLGFQIATAIATGPTSAVTTMLAQGADIMAEKTADDDAQQENKDTAILAGAGITAITEKYGLDKILTRVPPAVKNKVLRQIADISIAGGIEAAQEFTEGLLHDVTRRLLTNADAPILENIDREMIAAGGSAAIVRGVINATLGVRVRNDYKERAKLQEDFFKSLGENAESAKLRERLPEAYQEIVKDITKDGPVENVYAPVEFFQSHFQEQNIDPRQLATELGIERQYDEAINTGGKIAIPLDVYAKNLAPTEHNAVFAKELSFAPDQMSSRETEEFLKEAEKEKEPEVDTFRESLEQAMTPIREQLKAIYPADVAEKNAAVFEARLRTRAQRLGVDPQQLMKERPIQITEGGAETGSVLNQIAYHGSPYQFKRFDMSKIGTGEGAQAYGYGLYFAENPGVATSYSKLGKIAEIGGVPVSGKGVSSSNLDAAQKLGINKASLDRLALSDFDVKKTLTELGEEYNSAKTIGDKSYLMQQIGDLKRLMKSDVEVKGGNLYKVDISDTAIKNFLDWDKPLSEQPESVRKALEKLGYKHDAAESAAFDDALLEALTEDGKTSLPKQPSNPTGADIYRKLASKEGSTWLDPNMASEANVSKKLSELGIQGIRYLDQGSRKDGKGTSNFVVFDDSIIKILDVNGEPVSKQEQKKIVDAMHKEGGEAAGAELMQAQKQTETPEFKKWFGESKVVDENGKPLVVYHGTGNSFDVFDADMDPRVFETDRGLFFFTANKKDASDYAEIAADKRYRGDFSGANVVPVYLSITKPLIEEVDGDANVHWDTNGDTILRVARRLGHDGVIIRGAEGTDVYIAFRPEQIKSATGNRGTFDPNDPNILKQEGQDVKRGSISVSPTGDVIRLFQAKNLSTLLHELSHRWLFEMQDDAALPNAPQQIKDDLAATLKYLGVESVDELDITKIPKGTAAYAKAVAANEKFAETGEAYFMEGKAPSAALRRVFAQIRAWLVAVYKALKQGKLDVELTPEMRGVFDRLLATDEEIAQAKAEANAVPIFTTAVDAGMTDTEFAAFRKTIEDANREEREELDAKVMDEYKRTLTEMYKEEKAKVQAEVEAELDKDPIYAAMAKMKENAIKIARSEAGSLPRSFTAKDGIPADMAAEMLGFTSGEAMVKALASVEPRGSRVARETNIRMDQRFGNLLTDGTLVEEARKAVMSDSRADVIAHEIKILNKMAKAAQNRIKSDRTSRRVGGEVYRSLVPKLADVREHAASVIAAKPIRELRPMQYYNAARQASREAVNDVRKGDYLMAGYNKGRELLNLELYRESVKAQDMIEDGNQKLQKVFIADIKQSKSRNMDMVNAARAILASHGLGKTDAAPSTYLDKMRQYDPETYENLRPIFEPAISSMKPFKEMTVEEYVGMRDAVFALMKTSRRSKQMEIDGKLIERDEAIANLVNRMMDLDKGKSKELRSTLDDLQKTKIGLLSAKAALRRVESWVTAMDGGPKGAFRTYIWNPVSDAVNQYRDKKREVVSRYLEIVQEVASTIKPGDIEAPELGFKFRGKNELLHALLHTGNESNKAKLLIGYGWGERSEEGILDTSRWDAFEKRMRDQGILTKADYDFAQNVWDMMEGMKPALQEAHHRMYGYYFNEVTAKEFSNEFGTYRGGYIPAKVDVNVVQEAEQRKDAEEIVQGQNSFAFPTTGRGATMSRVEGYARPLQLDMRTIPAHIDWAMRFAYLEPAVKDVARVVLDKDFAKSMNGLDPTTINHMLVPWLQRTAQQVTSTRGMNKWADKFWTGVRSRSGMQVMVLNVINTLQQFTGLTIAFTRVKPSNIRSAFWSYMTKNKEFSEEISEKSSFMRNRVFTSHNEVMQTIDDLLLNPSKYEKAKDFATKHGYFMQQATQGFVDQIVWHAAYSEALSKGQNDKDAVRHADSVVRETQGSFAPEDLSRFEAGTPFVRAFSMFYNYFNMQANLLGTEAANIASNELGLRKGAGRALYVYTFAFMIPAYIGGAIIRALVAGGLDEDDDDEYMDDLIRLFFGSQFEALTAMVPVAGPLVNTAVNQWNKKWYDDKITVSPAVTAVESAVRAPYSVYKSIVDDGNEKRAVKDTLSLIGMATGLPAGALGRPLGYLADVHQGKARPENALDVTRGLISGQDVNR